MSDVILTHMKKLYVWDDIKHFLTQSKKYNVPITVANWIVGYPTETQKDFMEYKKLINFLKENGSTIITQSTLTCGVNRNSELLKIVQMDWDRPVHWKSKVVDLDFNERVKRKQWLTTELQKINQAIWKPDISINRLHHG